MAESEGRKAGKTEEAKRPGEDCMNVRASQAAAHVTWANLRPRLAASAPKGVPEVSCVRVSCQRAVNTYLLTARPTNAQGLGLKGHPPHTTMRGRMRVLTSPA